MLSGGTPITGWTLWDPGRQISVGWGWGLAPDGALTGCHDSFAGGIRLTGNAVHDVLSSLHDGGGVYTLGGAPDSVLEGNAISGVGHPGIGSRGRSSTT